MNYSSRFWLFAPLGVFLALTAVAMTHWYALAGAVENKLDAMNGHQAAPGITLSFASKTVSGFPFNIDVVFDKFAIEGQGAHGPFRWTSEKFALHRLTYGRTQDIYEAAGNQSLSWTDAGGRSHGLNFLPGSLHASAIADSKGLARVDVEAVDAGGRDSSGAAFTAAGVQFHLRRDPKIDALDFQVSGSEIKSQGNSAGLFGDHISRVSFYATLTKGSAFADLLAGKGGWADAAADWRAKGGQVAMGPVEIKSSGLTLNANSFPDAGGDLAGVLEPLY
ncbi:MAG TPA: DUF2125 domain-containing protein [Rhizomicrobium sp.]|nr:DUF2125 domain-containing protein [Rhizomicrobium sp.]